MSLEERVVIEETSNESPTNTLFTHRHQRNRCCFQLPCFGPGPRPEYGGPSSGPSIWERIRVGETDNRWWARPITALKKIREWSEIVAGPKWKTFIRRFNRTGGGGGGGGGRHHRGHTSPGKFQYDPLSYALNFDEGQGQNGHFEDDFYPDNYPDFSSRFSARPSIELGKGAPAS